MAARAASFPLSAAASRIRSNWLASIKIGRLSSVALDNVSSKPAAAETLSDSRDDPCPAPTDGTAHHSIEIPCLDLLSGLTPAKVGALQLP